MHNTKTKKLVTLSLFGAIVVVLQVVATFINIGGFPITLTLVPIIIAGAIYGPGAGALMGLIFGVIVDTMVITGADPSGATMMSMHPIITLGTCLLKGTLAGLFSGMAYKAISNKKIAIFVSAFLAPVVNTSVFFICLIIFFQGTFASFIAALLSINFLIELGINVLLAPGLLRIINMRKK